MQHLQDQSGSGLGALVQGCRVLGFVGLAPLNPKPNPDCIHGGCRQHTRKATLDGEVCRPPELPQPGSRVRGGLILAGYFFRGLGLGFRFCLGEAHPNSAEEVSNDDMCTATFQDDEAVRESIV